MHFWVILTFKLGWKQETSSCRTLWKGFTTAVLQPKVSFRVTLILTLNKNSDLAFPSLEKYPKCIIKHKIYSTDLIQSYMLMCTADDTYVSVLAVKKTTEKPRNLENKISEPLQ